MEARNFDPNDVDVVEGVDLNMSPDSYIQKILNDERFLY